MGRTGRRRKKVIRFPFEGWSNITSLQKTMKVKGKYIKICYFENTGWGVKCRKKLEAGDTLMVLPLQNLISPYSWSDIFLLVSNHNYEPQMVLTVLLVYESHLDKKSQYFSYLKTLPKHYTNLYFCTAEETKLLPEFLLTFIADQRQKMEKIYENLLGHLNQKFCPHCNTHLPEIYKEEKFLWAWFTVNTRSVYYEVGGKNSLALAPLLDMFNHSNEAITQMSIDYTNKLYILKTLVPYKRHEQVFIKYGPHSNLKLLSEYGFILSNNPHDCVEFTFEEVVTTIKEFDRACGEITKYKYNFIRDHELNKKLTMNKDEFSWNLNGLIYVLTTKDENPARIQLKTYSNQFSMDEELTIKKIKNSLTGKKIKELEQSLSRMEALEHSSKSFLLAKTLVKIYINLLTPN